jgi:hypothetical protein
LADDADVGVGDRAWLGVAVGAQVADDVGACVCLAPVVGPGAVIAVSAGLEVAGAGALEHDSMTVAANRKDAALEASTEPS